MVKKLLTSFKKGFEALGSNFKDEYSANCVFLIVMKLKIKDILQNTIFTLKRFFRRVQDNNLEVVKITKRLRNFVPVSGIVYLH